jgi:hypothetical protein
VPVTLIVAKNTKPAYVAVIEWLEAHLNTRTISVPGPHGFYYYRPRDLADVVRPIFNGMLGTVGIRPDVTAQQRATD